MWKLVFCACLAGSLQATIFGRIQGIVHDPQHRPMAGASVKLQAITSDYSQTTQTNDNGEFSFTSVPVGDYKITVTQPNFDTAEQTVTVDSSSSPILHFQLAIATLSQTTVVVGQAGVANMDSVTPTTLVDRGDIAQTPGADRTNSMAMITDFTPGAYVTHDMLHMRGGHQVDWLIDGVPVPNTNIATNLGPQIDPKDIDYLEIQRGSYDAEYGDRTYGIFNIVPRTGFERDNEAELVVSFGNWYQTNDQFNFGGHTKRFAYYASVNGNRSNYGLQAPIGQVVHDAENGYGGFASFIFNASPSNQFRMVASLRRDYYQIPIDPNPNSAGNQVYPSYGLRDSEREPDGYVTFSWIHTFNPNLLLTVSPFYHYNQAAYNGGPNDVPVISTVHQTANYAGAQASLNATVLKNNDFQVGVYGFAQHQTNFFNNVFTDCAPSCQNFGPSSGSVTGGVGEAFISDRFKVTSWLTLIAGLRYSHFTTPGVGSEPGVIENAADPRYGIAIRIPKINWVFHGFYGDFYQAASTLDCYWSFARFSQQPDSDFRAPSGRARSRISIRRLDSFSRLGARGRQLSNPRDELAGPQQYRRIEYLLAAHLERRADSRLGNYAAFPAHVAPRSVPPGLLESDRTGHSADHRRRDLPCSRVAGMSRVHSARIFAGGPRSEKHVEPGRQFKSSLAGVRFDECVLRLGIHQRDAGRAISGELSASAHYVRYFAGKEFWREGQIQALGDRFECGESPRVARQQSDLRRIPL